MSGLAHYLEDEGLATVIVALVREHILSMNPPRALWVPFELGRPFGAPGDAELQTRVLTAALDLLDEDATEPLLVDFPEQAATAQDNPDWVAPTSLAHDNPLAELESLLPAWERACQRIGRTSVGISGLEPMQAAEYVARFLGDDPMPNPKGMAPIARARFAIDDLKALYLEAGYGNTGHPSTRQLHDWLWRETRMGDLLIDFQHRVRHSDDRNLRLISGGLVPAERTIEHRTDD